MPELDQIYEDEKAWMYFEGETKMKTEIINAVFNRNIRINEYKLNQLLDKLIKSELLKFHEWLSDENDDAYSEILIDEYLSQLKELKNGRED